MTFVRENLFWILIIAFFLVWLFNFFRDSYYAWKYPELLKRRSVASAEKWPKWLPYRSYYMEFYNSDNYVYLVRLVSIFLPTGWVILILALWAEIF